MQIFRLTLITLVVLALVNPTEAWGRRIRKAFKRLAKSAKKIVRRVKDPIKKLGCKVIFGIACPAAVGAAAAAITAGSGGAATAAGVVGATLGKNACHARKEKCRGRRSVISGEILLPFSDNFADYDQNEDKLISYEEFVFTVMEHFRMAAPEELQEPFVFADVNDDDHLDMDEFKGAPFLFQEFYSSQEEVSNTIPVVNTTDTTSNDIWSPAA